MGLDYTCSPAAIGPFNLDGVVPALAATRAVLRAAERRQGPDPDFWPLVRVDVVSSVLEGVWSAILDSPAVGARQCEVLADAMSEFGEMAEVESLLRWNLQEIAANKAR